MEKKISPVLKFLKIRNCRPDEIVLARSVYDEAFAPLKKTYRSFEEALTGQDKHFEEGVRLVAHLENLMVATMQYRLDARHIHLLGIAVLPVCQRHGIGRMLVDHVAAIAPKLGHDSLALETIVETKNISIFKKWGFEITHREVTTDYVSDRYPVLHLATMEREL